LPGTESDDGLAIIWNGVVQGSCYGGYEGGEFRGIINFTWLRGQAEELGDNSNGGGGGWSDPGDWGATATSLSTGETSAGGGSWYTGDTEVDKVLKAFYEDGTCTEGWEIYVDGARVC
jgi:hypothetical protein